MSSYLFKVARRMLGLNQTDLARLLGVTRATVSNWERGTVPPVDATGRPRPFDP